MTLEEEVLDGIILQNIDKYGNVDNEEVAVTIIKLINRINKNPKDTSLNLSIAWDKHCDNHNLCKKCGKELKTKVHNEVREYQGQLCNEEMTDYYCPDCG